MEGTGEMDRLLMIADDMTGALDAGVAFASSGAAVCVGKDSYFTEDAHAAACSVVVSVVPTRHVSAEEAYSMVRETVEKAATLGFTVIFKKTDSALRGNIGAELEAVLDASGGGSLCFVPAFPRMNRVTREGIHYINGNVPVSESVFAEDPFNPVRHSSVAEVIAETSSVTCCSGGCAGEGVHIFDASTDEDIRNAALCTTKEKGLKLFAGCAGMAEALNALLELPRDSRKEKVHAERLMVFCGSVNPISRAQCEEAAKDGAPFFHLIENGVSREGSGLAEEMAKASADSLVTLFDTGSAQPEGEGSPADAGKRMAARIGKFIRKVTSLQPDAAVFIIGGDTLLAFTEEMGIATLFPEGELLPGVVAASYEREGSRRFLIAKSGGFGERDLIGKIAHMICK